MVDIPGGNASWVHLDEGSGMSGHLLVSSASGGPVRLFDVRRVPRSHTAEAARELATLPPPANAGCTCFAAAGATLVVGGGAKCGEAWRYCGDRGDDAEGDAEEEEEEKRGKVKEKKKRQEKVLKRGSRQSRIA